jgi:hypothetical protein
MNLKTGYVFIIDTNEYAGNFEREMCAYVTGCVGECEVGEEFVDEETTQIFENFIKQVPDDDDCYRPCSTISSPNNKGNNSVAIYFENKPQNELITLMKVRANQFNEVRKTTGRMAQFYKDSNIQILGFRLIEVKQSQIEISI